jgi:hypothetical protein
MGAAGSAASRCPTPSAAAPSPTGAKELIVRAGAEARSVGGRTVTQAARDHRVSWSVAMRASFRHESH